MSIAPFRSGPPACASRGAGTTPRLAWRQQAQVALCLIHDDQPLFRRTLNWAMRSREMATPWPNDLIALRWVQLR